MNLGKLAGMYAKMAASKKPQGGMRFNPDVLLDTSQVEGRRGQRPITATPDNRMNQSDPFDTVRQFMAMRGDTQLPEMQAPPQAQVQNQMMPARGPAASGGSGTYDDWVNTIAQLKGLSPEDRDAFYQLGMGESGGRNIPQGIQDYNSENGIPAFGPWQVIEPTFNQYKEPGYDNWKDPIANGLASLNYQRARYGKLRSKPGY